MAIHYSRAADIVLQIADHDVVPITSAMCMELVQRIEAPSADSLDRTPSYGIRARRTRWFPAPRTRVRDLPEETLVFLLGTALRDGSALNAAWNLFSQTPRDGLACSDLRLCQ